MARGRRLEKKVSTERDVNGDSTPEAQSDTNGHNVFFGLVDANELEYFKQAEQTLNINSFESDLDRQGFIHSVFEEAKGKELKLMTNQICSKLMERLLLGCSDDEVIQVMAAVAPFFTALAHQKYSSHVLETLLVRGAALVEKEQAGAEFEGDATTESLFEQIATQMIPETPKLMIHSYASHVLRLMLLVLAGKELPSTVVANLTLRSKKLKIARKMIEIKDNADFGRAYEVPLSFKPLLKGICDQVASKALDDKTGLRELAINKVALPVLQLLIQVEGISNRDRPIWHLIFEDGEVSEKEGSFIEYLLSDSVGSHFLESCVKLELVRQRYIERLYRHYMQLRILKLSNRATLGVYIVQALLFRLKPREVELMLDELIPELPNLVNVAENANLDLAQKVIDALIARGNYRRDELISQLLEKFSANLLDLVLQLDSLTLGNTRDDWPTAEERRRLLFLEKLIEYDSRFTRRVWQNLMELPTERFIQMCFHGVFSHVVEAALIVDPQETKQEQIMRKRFLLTFLGHVVALLCNSYGSHIVDKLWHFTVLLTMFKDRFAQEMLLEQAKVKDSQYGRMVWKNWSMEQFVRRKLDWRLLIKQQELDFNEHHGRAQNSIERKLAQMHEEKQRKESTNSKNFEDPPRKRARGRGRQ